MQHRWFAVLRKNMPVVQVQSGKNAHNSHPANQQFKIQARVRHQKLHTQQKTYGNYHGTTDCRDYGTQGTRSRTPSVCYLPPTISHTRTRYLHPLHTPRPSTPFAHVTRGKYGETTPQRRRWVRNVPWCPKTRTRRSSMRQSTHRGRNPTRAVERIWA